MNVAVSTIKEFLDGIGFINAICCFQFILVVFSILVRSIYIVCVFTDGARFDYAHRSVLVSLFRSAFWFGVGFKTLLWLVGDSLIRSIIINENMFEAVLIFICALISYVFGLLALLRKKHVQRLFISNNLLKTGNLSLVLSILLALLAWTLG